MAELLYAPVIFFQKLHFMSMIAQQGDLSDARLLFATQYPIPVMEHEYFHGG
jgi:hypothetical protein